MNSARLKTASLAALAVVGAAFAATPAGAHARDEPSFGQDDLAIPEGIVPGVRQADGRACVKQCPDDRSPCDPPVFKRADGRCTQER